MTSGRTRSARPPKPARLTEAEFTAQVIAFARLHRWRVAHFRPALTRRGWRTAVQGDGAGFPDLVCVRGGRVVVAELKVGRGKTTEAQDDWLAAFGRTDARAYLWRGPDDWPVIESVLAGGGGG
jgi:hypothetical protein